MRVFAISGYSGTGKTSLVESIVNTLVKNGYSVATIKSSKHPSGPEHGKDTWRHMQAGAAVSFFMGPNKDSNRLKDTLRTDELEALSDHDFLIIEGMKSSNIPKFWCVANNELVLEEIPANTQAIVSWSGREPMQGLNIPLLSIDEIEELVEVVKAKSMDFSKIE